MSSVGISQTSDAGAARTRINPSIFCASSVFFILYLLSMPIYCLVRLSGQQTLIGPSTAFTATSLFAFSLTHCIETRGARRAALMLSAGFAIALTTEYLGSTYGLIFGSYDYTDNLGPKALGKVPIIIPIAWFMMLYPAWHIASLLTLQLTRCSMQHATRSTQYPLRIAHSVRTSRIAHATAHIVIAALAMTAWDLSLDPRMVTDGNWVWPNGGPYFGIPLSNYAGWFITSALIYCIWRIVDLPTVQSPTTRCITQPSHFRFSILNSRFLPLWAYVVTWLGESLANAVFWGRLAVGAAVFVGMGLFAAPTLLILLRTARQLLYLTQQPACSS